MLQQKLGFEKKLIRLKFDAKRLNIFANFKNLRNYFKDETNHINSSMTPQRPNPTAPTLFVPMPISGLLTTTPNHFPVSPFYNCF